MDNNEKIFFVEDDVMVNYSPTPTSFYGLLKQDWNRTSGRMRGCFIALHGFYFMIIGLKLVGWI